MSLLYIAPLPKLDDNRYAGCATMSNRNLSGDASTRRARDMPAPRRRRQGRASARRPNIIGGTLPSPPPLPP